MTVSALVEPAYFTYPDYSRTLGDEVADLNILAGFAPDPEQRLVLDAMFALDRRGNHAAFEVCVICSRQNLKTGLFKMAALGKAFILDRKLIVWSAHEFSTTQEAFRDLCELVEGCPALDSRVKHIHKASGAEAIELLSGARIKFKARTKTGGRGLSGEDVVLDEAFALNPTHMGALLPTLSAQPDPQVWYGSSAGLADSAVLRAIRDRGRKGDRALVYAEWGSEPGGCQESNCDHELSAVGCALDDETKWLQANPQMGRRITVSYIRNERRALDPVEFGRERLGWWDEPGELAHIFGAEKWSRCGIPGKEDPPTEGIALGVAVSIDRAWTSISAAVPLAGRQLVGVLARERGTAWVIPEVARLQAAYGCDVVVDRRGPAADLIDPMGEVGVTVTEASTTDVLDASAAFYDKVQTGVIAHMSHPELEDAVRGAQKRPVSDRWAVGRKASTNDVSPLEAAILATWAISGDYDVLESIH